MTIALLVAAVAAFALAFANGANDNSKGVATLIGSGTMRQRTAIVYGTVMTLLGSIAALLLAGTLIRTFGGKGIVPEEIIATSAFPISVGVAAASTVLLATRVGIPISTTHSLVGALVGVGLASELIWTGVWTKFMYPLLAAPLLAVLLTIPVYIVFRWTRLRLGIDTASCLCFETAPACAGDAYADPATAGLVAGRRTAAVRAGHLADCRRPLAGTIVGIDAQRALDWSHLCTAGAVSFARGLKDTPKIAGILLAAGAIAAVDGSVLGPTPALLATGIGIALGGMLAARRVAFTMSRRITDMNDGQAFTANLVTAGLVIFASRLGVPVSTTHVSCGSLFGIGAVNKTARWRMIGTILLAWVTTLPMAAAIGWVTWSVLA